MKYCIGGNVEHYEGREIAIGWLHPCFFCSIINWCKIHEENITVNIEIIIGFKYFIE